MNARDRNHYSCTPANLQRPRSRREFLQFMGMAGAAVSVPAGPSASATGPTMVGKDAVVKWHEGLADTGTRFTGSSGESKWIDYLSDQFERLGLKVNEDRLTLDSWAATRWELVRENGTPVPVAYYFPYSGETPEEGVEGRVVYCGTQTKDGHYKLPDGTETTDASRFFAPASGHIALIGADTVLQDRSDFFLAEGFSSDKAKEEWPKTWGGPYSQAFQNPPDLAGAKNNGARAVICAWTSGSDDEVAYQYNPFSGAYQGIPALWVNQTQATVLRRLAEDGEKVTLTLTAERTKGAATRSIWVTIPGATSDETALVGTHLDGGNALDENGAIGHLAFADYFLQMDKNDRRRDIVLFLVTGHFQLPQFVVPGGYGATSRWKADHPDLWDKAVMAMEIEHLGAMEYPTPAEADGQWVPSGQPYWSQAFTASKGAGSPASPLSDVYLREAMAEGLPRTVAAQCPSTSSFLGEGQQFFADRIPTVAFLATPTYLLRSGPDLEYSKINHDLMYSQVRTLLGTFKSLAM